MKRPEQGTVPGDFPDPAAASASHKHIPSSPGVCFWLGQGAVYCLSFSQISNFSSRAFLLKNKGHATGQMAVGPSARRSTWGSQAKPIGKHPWGGQTPVAGTTVQWMD